MTARQRRTAAAALGLSATLVLAACGSSAPADGSTSDDGDLTVGLISSASNEWGTCMVGGVEAAAAEAGVELFTAASDADAAKEMSNVEDMISRGVDVILMNTVSVDALEGGVQRAAAADIPMYLIAVMPQDLDVLGATVVDLAGVGELAAEWIAEDAAGADVTLGIVAGAPGASSDLTIGGLREALPDNVTVVAEQPGMYNRAQAMSVAENIIEANADLDYAFVLNEDMAFGVSQAFQAAGRDDVRIVTQNGTEPGLEAIEAGEFAATIADSAHNLGASSFERALELLETPSEEKVSAMETLLVTAENLDEAVPFCGAP